MKCNMVVSLIIDAVKISLSTEATYWHINEEGYTGPRANRLKHPHILT